MSHSHSQVAKLLRSLVSIIRCLPHPRRWPHRSRFSSIDGLRAEMRPLHSHVSPLIDASAFRSQGAKPPRSLVPSFDVPAPEARPHPLSAADGSDLARLLRFLISHRSMPPAPEVRLLHSRYSHSPICSPIDDASRTRSRSANLSALSFQSFDAPAPEARPHPLSAADGSDLARLLRSLRFSSFDASRA